MKENIFNVVGLLVFAITAFGSGYYHGHKDGVLDGAVASIKALDQSKGLVRDVECVTQPKRPVRTINEPAPYVPEPDSWE